MKRIFAFIALAIVAVFGLTGCNLFYYEEMDTFVEWGFAEKENSEIQLGLESLLPSAQTIYEAFDATFSKAGESMGRPHEVMFRAQNGEKAALKNARKLAEEAAAKIPADHTCPVDYIWVVNIKYGGTGAPKTAWSHDYRK